MCLNHPETTPTPPTPVCGKTIFHKTGPWCQKGWGLLMKWKRSFPFATF